MLNRFNRNITAPAVCWACIVSACGSAAAYAQQPTPEPATPARQRPAEDFPTNAKTEVLVLKHVTAQDLAPALMQTLRSLRIAVDESANRLVISGSEEMIEQGKRLVESLDTPNAKPSRVTEFVRSPVPINKELLNLIQSVVSRDTRIAERDSLLVITGTSADVAAVRRVMEEVQLDLNASNSASAAQPAPRALRVSFAFLIGSIGGGATDPAPRPLPRQLEPVAAALQESGFSQVGLLAPVEVHLSDAGEEFQLSGSARYAELPLSLRVKGLATPNDGRNPAQQSFVRLRVEAALAMDQPMNPANPAAPMMMQHVSLFNIQTAIEARLDEFVVLAASPTSLGGDEVIALVVRVTEIK